MLKNREVILAKVETTYGIDPGLAAADDAILVVSPSWSYTGVRMHEREVVKATFAKKKPIFGGMLQQVTMNCEIKGSGTAGTAPEFGPLLRACGHSETIVGGTSTTYALVSSSHASCTIYYYMDGKLFVLTGCRGEIAPDCQTGKPGMLSFTLTGHTKMRGTAQSGTSTTIVLPATFSAVDDAYNGRTIKITSGTGAQQTATITDYTGASKTVTVASWSVATPDSTSVFEIDNGPIDVALPTPTYDSAVPVPLIAVPFLVNSYGAVISKLGYSSGNQVATPPDIAAPDGYGEIRITGHGITGSFDPEAVLVATHDFIGKFKAGTAMALDTGLIGGTAGNRWRLQMPAITYNQAPGKGDRDNITTYDLSFMSAESSSDDTVSLAFT